LCLSRHLLRLVGHLTGGVLRLLSSLARGVLDLLGGPTSGVLHALGYLAHLVRDPAERTALLLAVALAACEAAGQASHGFLHLSRSLACLVGYLPRGVLGLLGDLSGLVRGLTHYLLGLPRGLACGVLGLLRGLARGPVLAGLFHGFGRFDHVADDDTAVATSAFDLCEVYTPLLRLAEGRVRGVDLALAPDLVRIEVGYVFLRFVYGIFHGRVVIHQFLEQRLEGLLAPARDLVGQTI
jgi:hypothetical protein